MLYSPHQLAFFAHQLTRRAASSSMEAMAGALLDAQVDLNPHQIDAAMFATSNPLSKGVILADEVGLGKTIEAGLLIAQRWAERKRRILVITPANLRKQWHQELADKFGLPATIFEAKSFRQFVKEGAVNPFNRSGIIICSYQFAARKAVEVKAVAWDLVVIDEAHRLRNVYKPENKTARALQEALSQPQKVLLTATPLQNSLLELYGLVSFIDERVFGDLDSFKSQFGALKNAESFDALKNRIAPICKRTLRRQVEAYVKYTKRIPLLREFTPSADETALYNHVTEYLEREALHALPNSQRQLITLVLRKLLASSTFAIAGALETLTNRLKKTLAEKASTLDKGADNGRGLIDELDEDFETLDEIAEETNDVTSDLPVDEAQARTKEQVQAIAQEIEDLEGFRKLAVSITENAKGTALLQALKVAFAKLDELGAAKKAIIFTESRRTQDYLMGLLAATPYNDGVVLFNGTNNDAASKRIYADWIKRHAGTDRVTGSRTADTRAALVEHFREYGNDGQGPNGSIMIATEAGAEGINLQFCSMVINYDLPWNPQRIEQRIGRCHRYGQKHDVVVVNFLNRENEADKRVYELLDQKFKLFDGVFGASDEVLGAVESGVDFERRIAEIYQTCRQPAAIHTAFEQLQLDMAGEISDAMLKARKSLLENFDEDVQERLRLRSQDAKASLGKLERLLMRFTSGALNGHAEFTDDETSFVLKATPSFLANMAGQADLDAGRYELPRRSEDAHIYRLGHPLAQALLQHAKQQPGLTTTSPATKIVLDYAAYGAKVSVVEPLRGQHGWLEVQSLQIRSLGAVEEHLLVAAVDANGNAFDAQVTERLLNLPCASNVQVESSSAEHRPPLEAEIERQKILVVADLETRNLGAFTQETEKLDAWADDLKVGLERDIKELDRRIKESRTKSKGAATLADKLAAQKEQRDLEGQRDKKRRELFDRQDEIQRKRDGLIDELERQLKQEISVSTVLTCEWELT
jgi:ERCC4-related helicase